MKAFRRLGMAIRESSISAASTPNHQEAAVPSFGPVEPRKTQLRSSRTRELLLEAAEEIFVRDGYEKAALADIARIAGKTRGAIYSHFKNKEEMFLTLVESRALGRGSVMQEMLAELRPAEGLSSAALQRFIGSGIDAHEGVLLMEFLLYALRHPNLNDKLGDTLYRHRTQ
jgi:AcrR family transcriptional regulator